MFSVEILLGATFCNEKSTKSLSYSSIICERINGYLGAFVRPVIQEISASDEYTTGLECL